jgi:MFS transporter, DHA3 family, tetracycline resistance protein
MTSNKLFFLFSVGLQHFALGTLISSFFLYANQNGVAITSLAFVSLITAIISFFFEPVTSFLADKYSKKLILLLGYICLILAFFSLTLGGYLFLLSISQIFSTFGLAFLSGTEESYLHDQDKTQTEMQFAKQLSLMQIFDEVGTVLGTIVIGFLASYYGFQISYWSGIIALLLGFMFILVSRNTQPIKNSQNLKSYFDGLIPHLKLEKGKVFKFLLPICLLYVFISFRGDETWQIAMKTYNLPIYLIGFAFGVGKISSLISSFLVYRFGDKIFPKQAISGGIFLQAVGYLVFLIPSIWSPFVALILYFFGENLCRPYLKSLIISHSPPNLKTTFLSLISGFNRLFSFPVVFLVAFFTDQNVWFGLVLIFLIKLNSLIALIISKDIFEY